VIVLARVGQADASASGTGTGSPYAPIEQPEAESTPAAGNALAGTAEPRAMVLTGTSVVLAASMCTQEYGGNSSLTAAAAGYARRNGQVLRLAVQEVQAGPGWSAASEEGLQTEAFHMAFDLSGADKREGCMGLSRRCGRAVVRSTGD
jgi:hypothetical protein